MNECPFKVEALNNAIYIQGPDKTWVLERPANLEQLWEEMGQEDFADERIPYWTELWPASLALASWLIKMESTIKNRLCLDLGCGLGFTALLARTLGANVLGLDYELDSLLYAQRNAKLNGVHSPAWLCLDWRKPALLKQSVDYIWAGDILYEKKDAAPVFDFLAWSLAPEGCAWIAEPGRGVFNYFLDRCHERGWTMEKVFSQRVNALPCQDIKLDVGIWEVRAK